MLERLKDISYSIERNRRPISRVLLIVLLSALQLGGGFWLYSADTTRGTPAIIQSAGIAMPLFAAFMLAFGALTLVLLIARVKLNAVRMLVLTTPFILYMLFTAHGVTHGTISGQGFYFYLVFYFIGMVGIWGTD
jgi:hypothetical protein